MRCRAWLGGRYCRNHTKGTFCSAHAHLPEYPAAMQSLPKLVLDNIAANLRTADDIQQFRSSCKRIHSLVSRAPFEFSHEYRYFQRFFARYHLTVRQMFNAAQRYRRLDSRRQRSLKKIPRCVRTIEACRYSDIGTYQRNMLTFNEMLRDDVASQD